MELQLKTVEKLVSAAIYEGRVLMTLPVSLFSEKTADLSRLSISSNGQFYLLECPLLGNLVELTLAQAEELLEIKKTHNSESSELPPNR
jgi:hypothetical protein